MTAKQSPVEFRNLADRVAIHCPTFADFEKIKELFNIQFQEKSVWSKHKENTGINLSFINLESQGCVLYANYGDVTGSYKRDNYRIIPASEIIKSGVAFTDSGYNFIMAKAVIDLQAKVGKLEGQLEKLLEGNDDGKQE